MTIAQKRLMYKIKKLTEAKEQLVSDPVLGQTYRDYLIFLGIGFEKKKLWTKYWEEYYDSVRQPHNPVYADFVKMRNVFDKNNKPKIRKLAKRASQRIEDKYEFMPEPDCPEPLAILYGEGAQVAKKIKDIEKKIEELEDELSIYEFNREGYL